ncbi:MAG: hypothetical protein V1893_02175 [Candidatus Omnitrophota bacterium]
MKKFLKYQHGAGLVEFSITAVIFLIMIGMLYVAISSNRVVISEGQDKIKLQQETRKIIDSMERELKSSRSTTVMISPEGDSINFQVPVDWDLDEDIIDNSGDIEWGADENLNWSMTYLLGGTDNEQVIKRVFDASGSQQGADTVIANDINQFQITRDENKVLITITAQKTALDRREIQFTAGTEVLLRN